MLIQKILDFISDIFNTLFSDREQSQLKVAQDPKTPDQVLAELSQSRSLAVRCAVAEHPNTSAHTLEALVHSPDEMLRRVLLARLNVPLACLLVLMEDEYAEIRARAWRRLEQRLLQQRWADLAIFSSETRELFMNTNERARLVLLRKLFFVPEIWKRYVHQMVQFQVRNFVLYESDNLIYPLTEAPCWFALALYSTISQNDSERNELLQIDTRLAIEQISQGLEQLTIGDAIILHTFCDGLWKQREPLANEINVQKQNLDRLIQKKKTSRRDVLKQIELETSLLQVQLSQNQETLSQLDTQLKIFSVLSPLTCITRIQDVSTLLGADAGNPKGLAAIICSLNARGLQRWLVNVLVGSTLAELRGLQALARLLRGMYAAASTQQDGQLRYQGFYFILQTLQDFCLLAQESGVSFREKVLSTNPHPETWNTLDAILDGFGSIYVPHRTRNPELRFQEEYHRFKQDGNETWIRDLVKQGLGTRVVRAVTNQGAA